MTVTRKSGTTRLQWLTASVLLVITALAGLGLYSVRQDRRLVEQDAHQQALAFADSLARECQVRLGDDISGFTRWADAERRSLIRRAQNQSAAEPADKYGESNAIPPAGASISLEELPRVQCLVRDTNLFAPPDLLSVPLPPDWLFTVSPEWLAKWEEANSLLFRGSDPEAARMLLEDLRFCGERHLQAVADLHLALLVTSPGERFDKLVSMGGRFREVTTQSGVPLGDLALLHAISTAPESVSFDRLLHEVHSSATFAPSFLTGVILNRLEEHARTADDTIREQVHAIHTLWEMDNRSRAVLKTWLATNDPHAGSFYLDTGFGDVFVLSQSDAHTFTNVSIVGETPATTNVTSGRQFMVTLVPESVVEASLRGVAGDVARRWPEYFGVTFSLAGQQFEARHSALSRDAGSRVLATQIGTFSGARYPFAVNVHLADPALLFRQQRQRFWMFGGLIVAAAVVAVFGAWQLQKNLNAQIRLNEQKSNFVSSVSHELRAPIASVRLMAEGLERGKVQDPRKQAEYFQFIGQECRRLSSLIENVLDFSRIEQGRKQYEFEPTDVLALTRETVKLMEPYATERNVRLALETSDIQHPTSNIELVADGRALQQALINLIDNAIKHSPKGETITVRLEHQQPEAGGRKPVPLSPQRGEGSGVRGGSARDSQPSTLNLHISDHGPGIPPEEHEKIFERFHRLGSELRRETQGVGIGLSIVKHIVEAHGGRVIVHSTPGHGSRFTIELPMRNNHE